MNLITNEANINPASFQMWMKNVMLYGSMNWQPYVCFCEWYYINDMP